MGARSTRWLVGAMLVVLALGCAAPPGAQRERQSDCADVGSPSLMGTSGISYGPHVAQVAELLPACTDEAVGTIMFLPGGGYTELQRGMVHDPNVRRLRDQGWVVLIVDYRLAPLYQWPAQGSDVRRAIQWWRTTGAARWGAPSAPLVGLGWSAGGHLSEWATVREDGPVFDAGVSVAGGTYWPERLDRDAAIALLGINPSTARQLDASTVPHLDADDPRLLHVHARNDSIVAVRQAELLAARVEEHGDPSVHRVVIDDTCGHSLRCLTPERIDPFLAEVLVSHDEG